MYNRFNMYHTLFRQIPTSACHLMAVKHVMLAVCDSI